MITTQDLMVHVERVVRPIRATERRRLAMRRELLAHLSAAFEEERARADESAAFEAAKQRLGPPGDLTRSLQESVSLIERWLFALVPVPRWMARWERRIGRSTGSLGQTLGQRALSMLGTMVIAYGSAVVLALMLHVQYQAPMRHTLTDQPVRFVISNMIGGILQIWMMFQCFALQGAVMKGHSTRKPAVWIMVMLLIWLVDIVVLVADSVPQWTDVAATAGIGVAMVAALVGLGRLLRRIGTGYGEWLRLEVGD